MMLAVEDVLSEFAGEEVMNERGLPPGFRFHPTDEELINFYLASKVFNGGLCGIHIAEVDLNRCEPWELPEMAKMGEREWYFYSLRDRKYPTGLRTNRATTAGYWKATGKDKEVYGGGSGGGGSLVGMKKTLVFYKGRAPRGLKTKWVMHEYRLETDLSNRHTCKDEWVICRVFNKTGDRKNNTSQNHNQIINYHSLNHYNNMINPVISPVNGFIFSPVNESVKREPLSNGRNYICNNELDVGDYLENPLFQEAGYSLSSPSGDLHMILDSHLSVKFPML